MNAMGARKGNKASGAALLAVAIIVFIAYAYVMFETRYSLIIMKFTMVGAVGILLAVLGWIGYTMLTAPKEDNNSSTADRPSNSPSFPSSSS
jgi:threonine/homoserine/homoserine lactone efflux protein